MNFLKDIIKVDVSLNDINFIRRIGRNSLEKKPILIKFVSFRKKIEVLRLAKNLKGSSVSLSENYSNEIRQSRRLLLPFLYKARSIQCKAFLRQDKLIINDKRFYIEQLQQLEQEDKLSTLTSGASGTSEVGESDAEVRASQKSNRVLRQRTGQGRIDGKNKCDPILKWLGKEESKRATSSGKNKGETSSKQK